MYDSYLNDIFCGYHSSTYEAELDKRRLAAAPVGESGQEVLWFKQTIHNACGLYAILHAVTNGEPRERLSECAA